MVLTMTTNCLSGTWATTLPRERESTHPTGPPRFGIEPASSQMLSLSPRHWSISQTVLQLTAVQTRPPRLPHLFCACVRSWPTWMAPPIGQGHWHTRRVGMSSLVRRTRAACCSADAFASPSTTGNSGDSNSRLRKRDRTAHQPRSWSRSIALPMSRSNCCLSSSKSRQSYRGPQVYFPDDLISQSVSAPSSLGGDLLHPAPPAGSYARPWNF